MHAFDPIDVRLLELLQSDGKLAYARMGDDVGLSAPAVLERVRKLENAGVITGVRAIVDPQTVGLDVTAFVGVTIDGPEAVNTFVEAMDHVPHVQEVHHVTGHYTLLLKVRARNTMALERILDQMRRLPGVRATETMVALSTRTERTCVPVEATEAPRGRARARRR